MDGHSYDLTVFSYRHGGIEDQVLGQFLLHLGVLGQQLIHPIVVPLLPRQPHGQLRHVPVEAVAGDLAAGGEAGPR